MMKFHFIAKSSLILSFVGIITFLVKYTFATTLVFSRAAMAILLILFFIWQYVSNEIEKDGYPNVINYLLNFVVILFLSTTINFLLEYAVYNKLDTNYKYEIEEREYEGISAHREKKGLPPPKPINDEEIDIKYGFVGLLTYYKTGYILDIFVVIVFYLFALLFYKLDAD
jgi:predicted membrane protein